MIVGVDIGGTFTDVVCVDRTSNEIHFTKVSTNYEDIIGAVIDGIRKILGIIGAPPESVARIVHGTTIATNVVVQRRGAKTAILTTAGFQDTLEIGRLKRRSMYDLNIDVQTPVFLAPKRYRIGVPERLDYEGRVMKPLDEDFVRVAVKDLRGRHGIEAIAVTYLFSFKNNAHEVRTKEIINDLYPDLFVSLSSEVNPIYREYERTVVTTFDAYMRPVVERFMRNLERQLRDFGLEAEIHVMQSRGGVTSTRISGERPINLFLSGPAGGVVGAAKLARMADYTNVVTIDIGGTSCDVALISDGVPAVNPFGEIAGYSVPVSMVGVNTIGAGGGSLLWVDTSNTLRVGPHSAGSVPGPACYRRGGENPTVTDASLLLGYLNPVGFAGGAIELDPALAERAVASISGRLGMSPVTVALGAHRIMNVHMAEQIRSITIKRGYDPRAFTMMAFGGAGPLHAGALISMLGMKGCLIPQTPGVLSAFGLLSANVEIEQQTSFLCRIEQVDPKAMARTFDDLKTQCIELMRRDGLGTERSRATFSADLRYVGQSYEITVEVPEGRIDVAAVAAMAKAFEERYVRLYGFSNKTEMEVVNLRVVVYNAADPLNDLRLHGAGKGKVVADRIAEVWFLGEREPIRTRFHQRDVLTKGDSIAGPAVIEQPDTTVLVYPGQTATVDAQHNLLISGISRAYTQ